MGKAHLRFWLWLTKKKNILSYRCPTPIYGQVNIYLMMTVGYILSFYQIKKNNIFFVHHKKVNLKLKYSIKNLHVTLSSL